MYCTKHQALHLIVQVECRLFCTCSAIWSSTYNFLHWSSYISCNFMSAQVLCFHIVTSSSSRVSSWLESGIFLPCLFSFLFKAWWALFSACSPGSLPLQMPTKFKLSTVLLPTSFSWTSHVSSVRWTVGVNSSGKLCWLDDWLILKEVNLDASRWKVEAKHGIGRMLSSHVTSGSCTLSVLKSGLRQCFRHTYWVPCWAHNVNGAQKSGISAFILHLLPLRWLRLFESSA